MGPYSDLIFQMSLHLIQLPILTDNYAYLAVCSQTKACAVVDPGESDSVLEALDHHKFTPSLYLITHHHGDHVDGLSSLVARYPAPVYGSQFDLERHQIPHQTFGLRENDTVALGISSFSVIETPGHTLGHICFTWSDGIFSGDTLFAGGCGRLFEGDASMMYMSLQKIAALSDHTLIYCGHEYTDSNLAFAHTLEPNNSTLNQKISDVKTKRAKNISTIPTTLKEEKSYNPFLRAHVPELIHSVQKLFEIKNPKDPTLVFEATRLLKDQF